MSSTNRHEKSLLEPHGDNTVKAAQKRHWHLHTRVMLILCKAPRHPLGAKLTYHSNVRENSKHIIYVYFFHVADLRHWSSPISTNTFQHTLNVAPPIGHRRELSSTSSGHHGGACGKPKLNFSQYVYVNLRSVQILIWSHHVSFG